MMCHVSFVGEALNLRRTKKEKHIKENIFKVLKFHPSLSRDKSQKEIAKEGSLNLQDVHAGRYEQNNRPVGWNHVDTTATVKVPTTLRDFNLLRSNSTSWDDLKTIKISSNHPNIMTHNGALRLLS